MTILVKGRSLEALAHDLMLVNDLALGIDVSVREWLPGNPDRAKRVLLNHVVRILDEASRGKVAPIPVHIGFVAETGTMKGFADSESVCARTLGTTRSVVRHLLNEVSFSLLRDPFVELPRGMGLTRYKLWGEDRPGPEWYLTRVIPQ
jgi:hypothetical protein